MTADVLNPQGVLIVHCAVGPTMPLEPATGPAGTPPPELCRRLGLSVASDQAVVEIPIDERCVGRIELPPGRYTLNLQARIMAASKDLPAVVDIHANEVTEVTVQVDLGIR